MIKLNPSQTLAARPRAASSVWLLSVVVCCTAAPLTTRAATLYVWQDSPGPGPAYGDWASAAHTIQDAVDAAQAGDLVLVTNGVYASGGKAVGTNVLVSRVAVDKPITLQSVNGPQVTIVEGAQAPGGGNGDGAIRCVYLTNGAALSGFTLTNGATRNYVGYDIEQSGGGVWCESTNALVTNCTLTGNAASQSGGGAFSGTLNNCTLTGNSAHGGGGASGGVLNNCTLTGNSASGGGGAQGGVLNNCTLTGNSGIEGGGASGGVLNNCTLTGNSASDGGGGAYFCMFNNCTLTGNSAFDEGGGVAYSCTLNNCTLTGNSATYDAGGAYSCSLNNCIVYFNSNSKWGNYDASSTLNYCCTTPLPANGVGNISADPRLASASHLSAESPCIGAGSATYASGTDIDGDAWANPPSIGCDEYHAGAVTGPLTVSISADYTNLVKGFPVVLTALIAGRTDLSVWDFGDGSVAVNEPYTTHTWTAPGAYLVGLWAYNDSYPGGVIATLTIHVEEGLHYVSASSANPVAPYSSWATAATNIQDAVDVAPPGATIFVTNGAYAPVGVGTPLTLQSINGPGVTIINGGGSQGCVYLANGAAMAGFTLTNGLSDLGGGVYCESSSAVVSNCVLTHNTAIQGTGGGACGGTLNNCTLAGNSTRFGNGGGAFDATLNNCTLTGNLAEGGSQGFDGGYGGGAFLCTLNNCTLTGNEAESGGFGGGPEGGGAYASTLNNCIVYFNGSGGDYHRCELNYCCTAYLPLNGVGNIINAPLFVDQANGNLRLQSNSSCINSGNNTYVVGGTDLDGNPRIVRGTVDIGAYEYQGAGSTISYAWLQQYGLPTDGSADYTDPDHDGMNNWQEWVADTNPTNAASVLRLTILSNSPPVAVTFSSSAARRYTLLSCSNLTPSSAWTPVPGQTDIYGSGGVISLTDTNPPAPAFYRVSVRLP
jgi:parallel beta-helix repeat protein